MKKYFLTINLLSILCVSCNNDDASIPEGEIEIEDVGFFNLKVGNVWTYEYFRREGETKIFNSLGILEEQEIVSEQEINGERIFTIQVTISGVEEGASNYPAEDAATFQVKDSLGYLVRLNEGIIFSNESTEEYLRNEHLLEGIFGILLDTQETVEVPAGNFDCSVNEIYAKINDEGDLSIGRDEYLYAEGVGEILYRISFVTREQHVFEQRLISFDFPE